MILRVYAVYDQAVGAFMQPFMCRTDGEAKRMFLSSVVSNEAFARNYPDYGLYFVSEFNDVTGEYGVEAHERTFVPRIILSGREAHGLVEKQIPMPFNSEPASPVDLSDEAQLPSNR